MKINIFLSIVLLIIFSQKILSQWERTSLVTGGIAGLTANQTHLFALSNYIYQTSNNGLNWSSITEIGGSLNLIYVNGNNIFVTRSSYPSVFRSTNNGVNWSQFNLNALDGFEGLGGSGDNVYAGTISHGMRRSTNNGNTWNVVPGITNTITVIAANGNTVFAQKPGIGLLRSTDAGNRWTLTTLTNVLNTILISGNKIYAGAHNGVFISADNGITWDPSGLSNISVRTIAVDSTSIFAGSLTHGVHFSSNAGISWAIQNEGLANLKVTSLIIHGDYIYAGTLGDGVFRRPLSQLLAVENISSEIPNEFSLMQNYPNPFNPTTNFEFRTADFGFVNLTVYDALGNETAVLVNENLKPGTYKTSFDGSNLSTGIYFYVLKANNFKQTRKMILMK